MAKHARFMVVLVHGVSDENIRLMEPIIWRYDRGNSLEARVLWCKSVNASTIGPYLDVEAKRHDDEGFISALIPHSIILTIVGSAARKSLGFQWEDESR